MEGTRSSIGQLEALSSVGDLLPLSHLMQQSIAAVERTLTCWSALDGRPRLILKRDRMLLACSECATAMIQGSEFLKLERGRLTIAHSKDAAKFADVLSVSSEEAVTVLLRHGNRESHIIVRAIAIDSDLVCISLQKANGDHYVRLPDLGTAFRLTQSEARIAEDLYNGMSPQEIAEQHAISIHTVRAHLRRCYDKLNITSREQLWHRLSAYQM
jgi:DNA-binding CsgD family transcriptional regulator